MGSRGWQKGAVRGPDGKMLRNRNGNVVFKNTAAGKAYTAQQVQEVLGGEEQTQTAQTKIPPQNNPESATPGEARGGRSRD